MKRPAAQHWTYKGVDVFRGIRWFAPTSTGTLRADTKAGMRRLINNRRSAAAKADDAAKTLTVEYKD